MKPRKDYHRNHSKADELEDVCKPCKAQRDAARRRNRATVSMVSNFLCSNPNQCQLTHTRTCETPIMPSDASAQRGLSSPKA